MPIPAMFTDATTACDNCGHRRWTVHLTVTTRSPAAGTVLVAVPAPPSLDVTCGTCAGWLDPEDPVYAALYALLVDRFAPPEPVRLGRLHHLRSMLRRRVGTRA